LEQQVLEQSKVTAILDQVREELDDHRVSINENTNELQSNHSYLALIERKMDKLAERLDEITLLVKGKHQTSNFTITPLNQKEKDVFFGLYSLTEGRETTYKEIARKLCQTDTLVGSYITNMIEKGIPVLKTYRKGIIYLQLDDEFRKIQAKQNIVGLNTRLTYWMDRKEN